MILRKTAPARVKVGGASGTEKLGDGEFTAVVSVFNNIDSYGDKVVPGAFAKSLDAWAAKGDPIPVWFAHKTGDPDYLLGHVVKAWETDEGLVVHGKIRTDWPSTTAKAGQVLEAMKAGLITQFSFAFDVVEAAWVETKEADATGAKAWYELRELAIHEVGPCALGANRDTHLIDVKTAQAVELAHRAKAGRALSAQNESDLTSALAALDDSRDLIAGVLTSVEKTTPGLVPVKTDAALVSPPLAALAELLTITLADAGTTTEKGTSHA